MTVFRPDTSFPYLKVARENGIDYGEVMRFLEEFTSSEPDIAVMISYHPEWKRQVSDAWAKEYVRRLAVQRGMAHSAEEEMKNGAGDKMVPARL